MTKNIIILLLTFILVLFGIIYQAQQIRDLKAERTATVQLVNSLQDTIQHTRNSYNEIEASKAVLEATVDDLQQINGTLKEEQRELLQRLKNKPTVVAASRVETVTRVDTFYVIPTITAGRTSYRYATPFLSFDAALQADTLQVNDIQIWNTQYISYDRTKSGTVVRISNSNPYIQTTGIESIILPQAKRKSRLNGYLISAAAGAIISVILIK